MHLYKYIFTYIQYACAPFVNLHAFVFARVYMYE